MDAPFLITTLIVVVTPGIGVLYTLSAAFSRGSRAALIAAFGCTLGIVPHALAAIAGLAALLNASAVAFQALKYAGVAYLLFIAWKTLRERGALEIAEQADMRSARAIVARAITVNLLNPKLTLFFFAFLPQFVSARDPDSTARLLWMSAVFMAVTFVVFAAYGLLAAQVRRRVISEPRVMDWTRRTFAFAFVGLAAKLALTVR